MRGRDPDRMTRDEILAELGALLAAGYRRRICSIMRPGEEREISSNELAERPPTERPCASTREEVA
jgi:hypothetical protein